MDRLKELVRLHRMGETCHKVAKMLGISPNTERSYRLALEAAGLLEGSASELPEHDELKAVILKQMPRKKSEQQTSSLERYRSELEGYFKKGAGPKASYDRMRLKHEDFAGSYSAVKRMYQGWKREQKPSPEDVALTVQTKPGQIAQVDFGFVGKLLDSSSGLMRKAWVFVMVLGFSRLFYAKIVFDQRASTFQQLHVDAFTALGGVPHVLVPDNLKAAVIRAAFGCEEEASLNRSYRELARYFGFKIDPTPPRSPEKKGKVESGVKYVKGNFFKTLDADDIDSANRELMQWTEHIANQRTHGTTGRLPQELFDEQEKSCLLPLPHQPFEHLVWHQAKVLRDSHLHFDGRLYSVPWVHIGERLWLKATPESVKIYAKNERIATHRRRDSEKRSTQENHLPEFRRDYRHRDESYWISRANDLGEEVGRHIREVLESDDVLSHLRTAQAMVIALEKQPKQRAIKACSRAHAYGNLSLAGLKRIIELELDDEPGKGAGPQSGTLANPQYARGAEHYRKEEQQTGASS